MKVADTRRPQLRETKSKDLMTSVHMGKTQVRLPVKAQHSDKAFEYESPRAQDLSEDPVVLVRTYTIAPQTPRTRANPLPGTLIKSTKNPLTKTVSRHMFSTSLISSEPIVHPLQQTNTELKTKIQKLEDEIRKWRRLRILTLEKEKHLEQLQLSISLAEQEQEALKEEIDRGTACHQVKTRLFPGEKPDPWPALETQLTALRLRVTKVIAGRSQAL